MTKEAFWGGGVGGVWILKVVEKKRKESVNGKESVNSKSSELNNEKKKKTLKS